MPQGGGNNNQAKKKKKGHKPAHQNSFAFKHNPKSKLTDKILSSPNEGVCRRCYDKIEWRKKYRKYKPLTQPAKCNICEQRNVTRAYHTICQGCSRSEKAYSRMQKSGNEFTSSTSPPPAEDQSLQEGTSSTEVKEESSNKNKTRLKVCAICVKEPVMSHDETETANASCQQEVEQLEEELVAGEKVLKLRERRAIERKVDKLRKEEKEHRRLERKLAAGIVENDEDDNNDNSQNNDSDDDSNLSDTDEHGEETDDLLKAVGGKDKLLTGEAYQKMLLQRSNEQATNSS